MRALFKASLFYLSLCLYKCLRLETVGGLLFASSQWSVLVFSLTSLLFIESVVPWMKTLSSHKKMKEKKRNEALQQRIGHKIKRFECSCCCCFPRNRQPSVKKGGARTSCLHGKQHQQQKNIIPLFLLRLLYFVKEKTKIHWWAPGRSQSLDQGTNRTRNMKQNDAGSALLIIAWDKLPERSFGNERRLHCFQGRRASFRH